MTNISILYSSHNNYVLLEKEILPKIDFENFEVINVDDNSTSEQREVGRELCKKNNIIFLENKSQGVQFSIQTLLDYKTDQKESIDWIFVLQHDIYPITKKFFSKFTALINNVTTSEIGAIGFNVYDKNYCVESYESFKSDPNSKGWLGIAFLSSTKNFFRDLGFKRSVITIILNIYKVIRGRKLIARPLQRRIISPKTLYDFTKIAKKYDGLFTVDLPMWAAVAINVNIWNNYVTPDKNYKFLIWFNDIAMQFKINNKFCTTYQSLKLLHNQEIKGNYGLTVGSAVAAKNSKDLEMETYGNHLSYFESKWGFPYENPQSERLFINEKYNGTLIHKELNHDFREGPLKVFQIRDHEFE